VDADHLDHYGSIERINEGFTEFLMSVPAEGLIVLCEDDAGVRGLAASAGKRIRAQIAGYGMADSGESAIWAESVEPLGLGHRLEVNARRDGRKSTLGSLTLQVPGVHNVRNALAAAAVGVHLGLEWDRISAALAGFRGAGRRFEIRGERDGVLVVDDYAHHPTEVRATILGARTAFPGRRIISVFQPHLYSRTRDFMSEFADSLCESDAILVTDIYAARERPISGVRAADLVRAIANRNFDKTVMYVPDKSYAEGALLWISRPGDVVLTMGAGDVNTVADQFLMRLAA
jgi:UDP-N-acetylmuramate--alanine ligase